MDSPLARPSRLRRAFGARPQRIAADGHAAGDLPRRRRSFRTIGVAAVAVLVVGAGLYSIRLSPVASAGTVGAGSYSRTAPVANAVPLGCEGEPTNPREFLTERAPRGPVPTNDWWSSLLWKKKSASDSKCAFSQPLYAHPLAYDTFGDGLGMSYSQKPSVGPGSAVGEYQYTYAEQIRVGVTGLKASRTLVDGWSDWTVSPYWSDRHRQLRATIGHGLPISYFEVKGGAPRIKVRGTPTVWSNKQGRIGFSVAGSDYVAFAPTGGTWSVSGSIINGDLAAKNYFSVAVLPTTRKTSTTERARLAETFGRYAHAHVTGTRVSYRYDQAKGKVHTTYAVSTRAKEGSASGTALALYPHQWRHLVGSSPLASRYVSGRGRMKVVTGTKFRTTMRYTGVLPEVPAVGDNGGADLEKITEYLTAELGDPLRIGEKNDTYWTGKALGRAARIAEIADQLDLTAVRDSALAAIRTRLTDWFTASPGKTERVFYYDKKWGTLIGYPASFGSAEELNDHHFHYGYFVAAAATLAKFDPEWAADSRYGGMVDLLIRDANNYDRSDTRFPYLRDFDIYAGHDWASGHATFGAGNNQESSSEGINFANGLIQWGQATGDKKVRDAGIFILTTQATAIHEYWFDHTGENFPAKWHDYAAIVWGSGAAYSTWFSSEHEHIYGINMLPITGGHFYLGDYPARVRKTYDDFVRLNGGEPSSWQDIFLEYLALGDPDLALRQFRANSGFTSEEGESKAHTFHWIRNLAALGNVDSTVTANHPLAKVFTKNGVRTYVASNITDQTITVRFSNGKKLSVAAGKTATTGAHSWSGGNAVGGR